MEKKKEAGKEGNKVNSKVQFVIAFLIGFLLGLLIAPTFMGDQGTLPTTDEHDAQENVENAEQAENDGNTAGTEVPGTNTVSTSDQLAGDRVTIDTITLARSGWAVVHESEEGVPLNALGAQRFDAGEYANVYVDLLRNTEFENVYFVILYDDNGDGLFSLEDDMPLRETGGNTISTTFETIHIDRKN